MKKPYLFLVGLFIIMGTCSLIQGTWIPAKAYLAQFLLERAWQESLNNQTSIKPWPWADTTPVAKLYSKRLNISLIVLKGTSGEVLAFGPGFQSDSAPIGSGGNSVLAGHRDTSFSFLQHLRLGDELEVQILSGEKITYQVKGSSIQLADNIYLEQTDKPWLTLITCYPFDSIIPGQDDRYLIFAEIAST
ncbi:MAG: class GN sortase [Desulfotalea sp.]